MHLRSRPEVDELAPFLRAPPALAHFCTAPAAEGCSARERGDGHPGQSPRAASLSDQLAHIGQETVMTFEYVYVGFWSIMDT